MNLEGPLREQVGSGGSGWVVPPDRSQTESLSLLICSQRAEMAFADGLTVNLGLEFGFWNPRENSQRRSGNGRGLRLRGTDVNGRCRTWSCLPAPTFPQPARIGWISH